MRTLALELLCMLFDDWRSAQSGSRTSIRLSRAERAKLGKIREQIAADPAAPITLTRLCARVPRRSVAEGCIMTASQRVGPSGSNAHAIRPGPGAE